MIEKPANAVTGSVGATELLQNQLSGYATLRKFYSLRDSQGDKGLAASALVAVIQSADENIHGGLFEEIGVVPVDGLFALLGEAMVFVDRESAYT
jgi:hypothetical protein